jgi:hypothetical protein
MESAERELEQAFLKLPNLKHIGMALLQFINVVRRADDVVKTENGGFRLGCVGFSFPEGSEKIRMFVDVEISKLERRDLRFLPVRDGYPHPVCEIKNAGQLACAARYIESAHSKV